MLSNRPTRRDAVRFSAIATVQLVLTQPLPLVIRRSLQYRYSAHGDNINAIGDVSIAEPLKPLPRMAIDELMLSVDASTAWRVLIG